jgi:hypothetical protein
MDDRVAFDAFLKASVAPELAVRGFRRRGQRFVAARGSNELVVAFPRRGTFFTCDLAVVSALLRAEFGSMPPEHWRVRLGPVTLGYDKWWNLAEGIDAVADDFRAALGRGLDHLEPMSTDEGLRDAILRQALDDPRPLPPIMQSWVVALVRAVGPGDWANVGRIHPMIS